MATAAAVTPEPHEHAKPTIERAEKPAAALTPPTSEELNEHQQKEHEDSELSDLDLDDEEEEEVFPDHYWDEENGGKIPVFKPTMDQFRDFQKYIDKIDKYGMKSGIVKVIPPKEWRDSLPELNEKVKGIRIKNPITQEFNGTFGTYTQQNVEKQRSYNLPEWKALTEETQHQPPAKRGERRKNQKEVVRGGGSVRGRAAAAAAKAEQEDEGTPKAKRKPGRSRRGAPADDSDNDSVAAVPASEPPAKKARGRKPKGRVGNQNKSVTSRRLNNTAQTETHIDEKAFKNFDYHLEDVDEFTPERCAELETLYWKTMSFNQPMYAADMPGSLFDDTVTSWNVAHLPNVLDVLGTKVPGVNTAYLYMGMWKATFAWHLEDVDLYSINYIHFGAPKQWYSISQEDARKFERAMRQAWPVDAKNCDQFLRHKTYLISPDVLQKQYGVKVNKLVHYEGEFVITYPYGYHSGYNIGYNCAESVNFATDNWLEFGRIAKKCNCEPDNVWVDVGEIERKLRGEPTPEYYEETDSEDELEEEESKLPTPPASVKGTAKSRKRKRDTKKEEPKKKKKIKIRIRIPGKEPCCLCPNENPWETLLPTDNGKKAHKSCALYTPETFIADEDGTELVRGVANIDKARLELKCNFCRSKKGACFQCSAKKCTRAFHASCAVAAGVLVDAGLVPTFDAEGNEYFEQGFDFRCRYHRPKMPKVLDMDALESTKRVYTEAKNLTTGQPMQAQYHGGEVFGGLVVENRQSEQSLIVDVLPDGDRIELEYKWLCVLNPDDSVRPKPSAAAKPVPKDMNKNALALSNRQDGVPAQDDIFNTDEQYKWHDFYNYHTPPPGFLTVLWKAPSKLKLDVNAPDTLYYYLPEISTDAKVFFADKPGSKQVAPKGNFMDRVQPKQTYQYPAVKQAIAPAQPSAPIWRTHQPAISSAATLSRSNSITEKPYVYKPKEPAKPNNVLCGVDYQSLTNQRNFTADPLRRHSSVFSQQSITQQSPPLQHGSTQPTQTPQYTPQYNYQGGEVTRTSSGSVRPFPSDQYYSSKTLPAAYQGEYSRFRRESQGAQTLQRPNFEPAGYTPNYQSVKQQKTMLKQGQSSVPGAGSPFPTNPYAPAAERRASSSAPSNHSPLNAPLTPATTMSTMSKVEVSQSDSAYIQDLQRYPYLLNSFCRKPKVYESPYAIGGGYTPKYQPLELQKQTDGYDSKTMARHTPSNSISSQSRQTSQQWTPPSQVWDRAGLQKQTPPPPEHHYQQVAPSQRYVPVSHSTPQEFQRQIQGGMPSTASRDGAHARLLRDQGYAPANSAYASAPIYQQWNSLGNVYDSSKMYNSPKAPTPSPLSDNNTSGYGRGHTPTTVSNSNPWGTLPQPNIGMQPNPLNPVLQQSVMNERPPGASFNYNNPTLPQMGGDNGLGGHETWRYN
ncbi:Putative Zinc finger, PHD-type, JmjC domain, JmjN domain, Zinc finger, RING/FYVE/PHD-type [Septoria linicola]|uniref:[histone H3]-trimethyl-L-lysine(9) demethylase n=1 Tax=Septoria linicola TaxID=215465 RepID=A0A9Q9APK7_9PEZI|nr:Putative Zinc finger, PHD-type, JmjC domain, JmjN domain, Zinc finger, RING/FYVE/PHD-type [Septoria linicola]